MNFLSPFALLLGTLAVPLLLLYFLKVRRRQMRVSSLPCGRRPSATARPPPSSSGCSAIRC